MMAVPHTPWPIVRTHSVELTPQQRDQAQVVADHFAPTLTADIRTAGVKTGFLKGPSLYFEDHRSIALMTERSARRFEYRMLGLAGESDLYVVTQPRDCDHETRLLDAIDLGRPDVIGLDPGAVLETGDLALACLEDRKAFETIVARCASAGRLNIVPYQVTYGVWILARAIKKASGGEVQVAGPPYSISSFANDKTAFSDLVKRLLGPDATPETVQRETPVGLAHYLDDLAERAPSMIIKHPSSAGSLGNLRINGTKFQSIAERDREAWIRTQIIKIGWAPGQRLLASEWVSNVVDSPSVQMWLPAAEDGPPVVECVFAQSLVNSRHAFSGASRVKDDDPTTDALVSQATLIGLAFQKLGYFGRLSLDAVTQEASDPTSARPILWIEANARWGGVSIPMTIVNRLSGGRVPGRFIVRQSRHSERDTRDEAQGSTLRLIPEQTALDVLVHIDAARAEWTSWP